MDREQISDMIAASEARSDAKFERILGEVRLIGADVRTELATVKAQTAGLKTTIIITGLTVFLGLGALLIGMMAYGDSVFGRGMAVRDVVTSLAKDQQQAIEAAIQKATREASAPKP